MKLIGHTDPYDVGCCGEDYEYCTLCDDAEMANAMNSVETWKKNPSTTHTEPALEDGVCGTSGSQAAGIAYAIMPYL